jgi:2,5-diamino-6-(ribosylamino)-4(3H)-pyrimidinone 5'-phosphate reductase
MTIDGKIATKSGDSHISSNRDLKQLHGLRALSDAVMIGIGTQLNDDPLLTVRRVKGRNPIRVVVDSLAKTPPHSRLLSSKHGRVIVAVSNRAPKNRISQLVKAGARVLKCGTKRVNLKALLAKLYGMGVRRVLLEGGGRLNWSMLFGKLVDEIRVTVGPFVVGGENATTLVEGTGVKKMNHAIRLSLAHTERDGNEVVLTYKVRH